MTADLVRPALVVLDVNETLSDMAPLGRVFEEIGAPAHLAGTWFAQVLRDGFALTCAGVNEQFATIAQEGLRTLLDASSLERPVDDAVEHVMTALTSLSVHPDVPDGLRALGRLGIRVVTLSNGSASVAEGLLDRAGVRDRVEALLSVEDAPLWKPARAAYAYALEQTDATAEETMLVAVHPWDVDGAGRAGLRSAWINRAGGRYPQCFRGPDLEAGSLAALADELATWPS